MIYCYNLYTEYFENPYSRSSLVCNPMTEDIKLVANAQLLLFEALLLTIGRQLI